MKAGGPLYNTIVINRRFIDQKRLNFSGMALRIIRESAKSQVLKPIKLQVPPQTGSPQAPT